MPIFKQKDTMDLDIAENFDNFMRSHRVIADKSKPNSKLITHTELNVMKGSYCIVDDDYDEFVKLYKNYIKDGNWEIGLVERHNGKKVGPVISDFDFKSRVEKRSYTKKHIINIIKIFNDVMVDIFKIEPEQLQAFVYEKDKPTTEKKQNDTLYKDGFHIYWPYAPLLVEYRYLLYEIVLDKLKKEKTIDDIPSIEPLSEVFDYRVIYNNGIMMYKSNKPARTSYELTMVFDSDLEEMELEEFDFDTIVDTSLMRTFDDESSLELKNQSLINKCIGICKKRNYPTDFKRVFSSDDEESTDEESNESNNEESDEDIPKARNTKTKYENVFKEDKRQGNVCACCGKSFNHPPKDIEYIRELVDCLGRKRSNNYDDWIRVGWCLHRIWHGLLPEYIKFSKQSKKYEPGCCERIWKSSNINDSSYTLPSLIFWAKQDDPDRFTELFKIRMNELFAKAMSCSHDDIANVLHEMYRNDFRCVDIKDNVWFQFKNHRWVNIPQAYTLDEKISNEVFAEFANSNSMIFNTSSSIDHRENDDIKGLNKKILTMYNKLKDVNFKQSVIKACRNKFYDPEFEEKLNKSTNLVGFNNGVFDLNTLTFRDGDPEDYITFTAKYNFKEYNMDDPEVKGLEAYFASVQTDPEVRTYWLRLISTYIDGSTKNQQFIFWNGGGSNGKSTTFKLIKEAFGDYYSTFPVEVFTGKTPDATVATPVLADKRGKRFCGILECSRNAKLNVGTMKLYTGGDEITARGLYKDAIYFEPQFKLVIATNHLPRIEDLDNGCWRRIIVIPFNSRFTAEPRLGKKNEFKRDDDLPQNLIKWRGAFMWYLLRVIYPKYLEAEKKVKGSGLAVPKLVQEETEKYRLDSDKYYEFMKNYTVKASEDDKEDIRTLYPLFKEWFRAAYGDRPPNQKEFIDYFIKFDYKIINDRFLYGYKLKDECEDDNI
jgi:P4 family phage/plasmid primase-like protien